MRNHWSKSKIVYLSRHHRGPYIQILDLADSIKPAITLPSWRPHTCTEKKSHISGCKKNTLTFKHYKRHKLYQKVFGHWKILHQSYKQKSTSICRVKSPVGITAISKYCIHATMDDWQTTGQPLKNPADKPIIVTFQSFFLYITKQRCKESVYEDKKPHSC